MVQWLTEAHAPRGPGLGERPQRQRQRQLLRLALRAHRRQHRRHQAKATSSSSTSGAASTSLTASIYDITWTGVVGREPTEREQHVFETVRNARDAAIAAVEQAFAEGRPIRGFEADDAARAVIRAAGFADYFTHRTGHNIAHEIHGPGAHLDNLETHDERRILPNTCFSVEPGIYLPEFGVRSEIDMLTAPGKAWVTGKIQRELVRI